MRGGFPGEEDDKIENLIPHKNHCGLDHNKKAWASRCLAALLMKADVLSVFSCPVGVSSH